MIITVWLLLGIVGAVVFLTVAKTRQNEQQILAIGLAIAALVYVGFAIAADADSSWILIELAGLAVYGLLAALGLRYSKWWLMIGWLAHPIWDIQLHLLGSGAKFSPAWYTVFCCTFDLVIAAYIVYWKLKIDSQKGSKYEF